MCTPAVTRPQKVELMSEAEGLKQNKTKQKFFKSRELKKCLEMVLGVTHFNLENVKVKTQFTLTYSSTQAFQRSSYIGETLLIKLA